MIFYVSYIFNEFYVTASTDCITFGHNCGRS